MTKANCATLSGDAGSARDVFVRWERWRLAYNLALGCLVVGLAFATGGQDSNWPRFAGQCVIGSVLANLCYFAGPTTEAYLRWLGVRHRAATPLLYAAGLVLALGLAAMSVMSSLIPLF